MHSPAASEHSSGDFANNDSIRLPCGDDGIVSENYHASNGVALGQGAHKQSDKGIQDGARGSKSVVSALDSDKSTGSSETNGACYSSNNCGDRHAEASSVSSFITTARDINPPQRQLPTATNSSRQPAASTGDTPVNAWSLLCARVRGNAAPLVPQQPERSSVASVHHGSHHKQQQSAHGAAPTAAPVQSAGLYAANATVTYTYPDDDHTSPLDNNKCPLDTRHGALRRQWPLTGPLFAPSHRLYPPTAALRANHVPALSRSHPVPASLIGRVRASTPLDSRCTDSVAIALGAVEEELKSWAHQRRHCEQLKYKRCSSRGGGGSGGGGGSNGDGGGGAGSGTSGCSYGDSSSSGGGGPREQRASPTARSPPPPSRPLQPRARLFAAVKAGALRERAAAARGAARVAHGLEPSWCASALAAEMVSEVRHPRSSGAGAADDAAARSRARDVGGGGSSGGIRGGGGSGGGCSGVSQGRAGGAGSSRRCAGGACGNVRSCGDEGSSARGREEQRCTAEEIKRLLKASKGLRERALSADDVVTSSGSCASADEGEEVAREDGAAGGRMVASEAQHVLEASRQLRQRFGIE